MSDSYRPDHDSNRVSAKDRLGSRKPDQALYKAGPRRVRTEPQSYDDENSDMFGERKRDSYWSCGNAPFDLFHHPVPYSKHRDRRTQSDREDRYEDDYDEDTGRDRRGHSKNFYDKKYDKSRSTRGRGSFKSRGGRGYGHDDRDLLSVKKPVNSKFTNKRDDRNGKFSNFSPFSRDDSRGRGRGGFRGRGGPFNGSRNGYVPRDRDDNRPIRKVKKNLPLDDLVMGEFKGFMGFKWIANMESGDILDLSMVQADEFWLGKIRKLDVEHQPDLQCLARMIKDAMTTNPNVSLAKIDLSKNGLRYAEQFSPMVKTLDTITSLNLSYNKYEDHVELREYLGKWDSLQELNLAENPISDKEDVHMLAAKLRKDGNFKNLKILNGVVLRKVAGFMDLVTKDQEQDIEKAKGLPEIKKMSVNHEMIDDETKNFMLQYLEQFIQRFDVERVPGSDPSTTPNTGRAEALKDFYDPAATFSMITSSPSGRSHEIKESLDRIDHLHKYSRSLTVKNVAKKVALADGRDEILSIFSKLPDFKHKSYDNVDISYKEADMIHVTYSGTIYELISAQTNKVSIRRITRSIIVSPNQSETEAANMPVVIINDLMLLKAVVDSTGSRQSARENLRQQSEEKSRQAEKELEQKSIQMNIAISVMDDDTKKKAQMLIKFGEHLKLKSEKYSIAKECLEKSGWDGEVAYAMFMNEKNKGNMDESWFIGS